jgi:hypothetical protein
LEPPELLDHLAESQRLESTPEEIIISVENYALYDGHGIRPQAA